MQIFDLFGDVSIRGDNQVNNSLNKIGDTLSNVGGKMMQFGGALTAGITVPLAGLVFQGVKYNSTVEDLQTSFSVLLGSEEKAIDLTGKLKKVGAETPFEITGLAQASKTLLAFGVEQDKLIPTMTRIGDVSLGNNEAFQSMSRVMGQISALGKLQGGDLNQLINWGWNPLNEITNRTGESMEKVRKRMSAGKVSYKEVEQALKDATSEGGRFYEGMAKGSETLSGKLSTLSDVFNDFLGKVTKPLFDYIQNKAVPFLTNLIEKFDKLDPWVKDISVKFALLFGAIGPLLLVGGTLITVLGGIVTAISAISLPVVAVIGALVVFVAEWAAIITVFTIIAQKTGILQAVFNFLKDVISAINAVIQGDTQKSFEILTEKLGMSAEDAKNWTSKIYDAKEAVLKVIEVVKSVAKLIGAIFTNDSQAMVDLLQQKFKFTWEEAVQFAKKVNELRHKIKEMGEKAKEIALNFIAKFADKIKETAQQIWDHRQEIAKSIEKLIEFGTAAADLAKKFYKAFSDIKKTAKDTMNAISQIAMPGFNIVGNASGSMNFGGGMSWVGERGPELVALPNGSRIHTAAESMSIMNKTASNNSNDIYNINVTLDARNVKDFNNVIAWIENLKVEAVTRRYA
jgi:tape measure domain-containing protein